MIADCYVSFFFFFSSRRRHTRCSRDWSSDVCSSDLERERPFTTYPNQLARYLVGRYGIGQGQRLLDIGCGRGEFLRGFMRCGAQGYGVDQSRAAAQLCPEAEVRTADLENESLPFQDDFFDVVFSKSMIEHFYYP